MYKRNDNAIDVSTGRTVVVLGPEDFDGYDYNNPSSGSSKWQLIKCANGLIAWINEKSLGLIVNGQ